MSIGTSLLDLDWAARGAASGRAVAAGCGAAGEKSIIIEPWPGEPTRALVGAAMGDDPATGSDEMDLQVRACYS